MYKLSKDLLVCLSFSNCILYLKKFSKIVSYTTLILSDKAQATSREIGTTTNLNPATDNATEIEVAPLTATVSTEFYVVALFKFFDFCFNL